MSGISKLVFVVSVLLVICFSSMAAAQPAPRIVGGTIVPDNRYPFMASIYYDPDGDSSFFPGCGGSLVGSRWVMTAAHCVVDGVTGEQIATSSVAVLVGAIDLSDESQGTLLVAENIYVHPDYSIRTLLSDIALIELPEEVTIPVMSLPIEGSDVPTVDELAIVAGWGLIEEGGSSSSVLREVAIPIVPHARCLPFYAATLQLDANVCAAGDVAGGRDSCQGDSGGPLFVARNGFWVQAGIVSYGEGCARPNIPGVYTRVSTYTDWVAGFVPDLQTSNGGSGTPDNEEVLDESGIVVLSAGSPTNSGSLLQGQVAVFEVTGTTRIELRSLSGDADLFIFANTTFEADDILCISENVTPLDACDLPGTVERIFATVYSYTDSSFEITAIHPIQDLPVVEEDLPVVEEDLPLVEEQAPNDDTQVSSGDGSSGGGALGGLSLLILSAPVFARRRQRRQ